MVRVRWLVLPWLLGFGATIASADATTSASPLAGLQVVALPGVDRRMDHLAVGTGGERLFRAALGNHTLEVRALAGGKRIPSLAGPEEPQGVAYLASLHKIVVATRAGGTVTFFDDRDYRRL